MSAPVLRLTEARFGYGGVVAAHAHLKADRGEVIALLGANGSGKSTLVRGSLGLIDCYGGASEWFGQPIDRRRRRPVVGYVPQRQLAASPLPSTLEELVRSGRLARNGMLRRTRPADSRAVAEAIDSVGLGDEHRTPVRELSGGQQRRALVARALAGEPDAVVLDEPFAGVDHENQESLATVFRSLAERGVMLLIVLHELGPLAEAVTRVVHMADGVVIFDGEPTQRPTTLDELGDYDHHCGDVAQPTPTFGLFPT